MTKIALDERKTLLREHKMCHKCFADKLLAKDCKMTSKRSLCNSKRHAATLHVDKMKAPLVILAR